jgi:hypothetical protein
MPMLASMVGATPLTSNGRCSARSSRSATSMAASGPPTSGSTTANSSPPTTDRVDVAKLLGQPRADLAQQHVARAMPQHVVDLLEPVEVDEQHRQPGAVAGRAQGVFQVQSEPEAVGQRADRVEVEQPLVALDTVVQRGRGLDQFGGPPLQVPAALLQPPAATSDGGGSQGGVETLEQLTVSLLWHAVPLP